MITDQDKRILDKFSREIRKRFPTAQVWAFGSRSRGTADWDSDFDICVVLDAESLAAGKLLLEQGLFRPSINRSYYVRCSIRSSHFFPLAGKKPQSMVGRLRFSKRSL